MYEHHSRPLAPRRVFARRLAASAALGCALLAASLAAGMLGYRYVVGEPWMQAFVDAAMILAGMGPVTTAFDSDAARLFAGLYALYSGFAAIAMAGIVFAPVAHRFLHRFHLDMEARR
ncbi:MAG: hypothetical protein U1F45_00935 [Burkholderiales bacterium]